VDKAIRPGVFFGTPEFAAMSLRALLDAGLKPDLVITQPDRPAGRRRAPTPSAVKQLAHAHGLALEQPPSLGDLSPRARETLQASDCALVVAYGGMLPAWVLCAPRFGCLNLHASLLPRWRGAAPVQRAILAGDAETGVCIMQMDEGLDTGAVLASRVCPVEGHTGGSLTQMLAGMGAELLLEALANYHSLTPAPQGESGATYAAKLTKQEARVDWSKSALQLAREVRAFNPAPVSWCLLGRGVQEPLRVRIWQAEAREDFVHGTTPGRILEVEDERITVAAGRGALAMQQIQLPGAQSMRVAAILRARSALFQRDGCFG